MKNSFLLLIIIVIIILAGYFLSPGIKLQEFEQENNKINYTEQNSEYENYKFITEYTVTIKNIKEAVMEVTVSLPETIKGKQFIKNLEYSPAPKNIIRENGRDEAVFEIKNPKKETKIRISGDAGVRTYDLESAINNPSAQKESYIEEKYTLPEQFIEANDKEIIAKAAELKGNSTLQTIKNVYYFVQRNMRYDDSKDTAGAKELLKTRKGKCSDYSALMIALLRANSIPARVVSGNIIDKISTQHTWVEVYLEKYGWVEFEPTILSKAKPEFDKSPNKYLISGINTITPAVVKLKIPVKDNRPRPDIFVLLENKTLFLDPETNEPI